MKGSSLDVFEILSRPRFESGNSRIRGSSVNRSVARFGMPMHNCLLNLQFYTVPWAVKTISYWFHIDFALSIPD
jgi:hypothetical protein